MLHSLFSVKSLSDKANRDDKWFYETANEGIIMHIILF